MKQAPVRQTDNVKGESAAASGGQSQVIVRALQLLFDIAGADRPVSHAELGSRLGIPRSSVYRLVATLEGEGLVVATDRGLTPTPRFFFLSSGGQSTATLAQVAERRVADLAHVTGETAALQVQVGTYRRCVVSVEGSGGIRWAHGVGYTAPVWAGANGHVLLAALPESECADLLATVEFEQLAPGTVVDIDAVNERVTAARVNGWSMSVEEVEAGAAAIAVPVPRMSRPVALNLYAPTSRGEHLRNSLPELQRVANEISAEWTRIHDG